MCVCVCGGGWGRRERDLVRIFDVDDVIDDDEEVCRVDEMKKKKTLFDLNEKHSPQFRVRDPIYIGG